MGTPRATTAEFIEKAKKVHGDKYDYSLVKYLGDKLKVDIICKVHGVFSQTPSNYCRGGGCPSCARDKRRSNTQEFIEKAKKVHGDKYDYSLAEYLGNKSKVSIICKIHGVFEQTPKGHYRKEGCPNCASSKRSSNTQEFIEKARSIHGDKYDYSLVEYLGNKSRVTIICKIHGEFLQTPSGHHQGGGCPDCGGKLKLTTAGFAEKARKVHGDRYDYSLVEYQRSRSKVKIICKTHGVFEQEPRSHLSGYGCDPCGLSSCYSFPNSNTQEFIEKARSIHGDKYDYSLVEYKDSVSKVSIICKTHGEFKQEVSGHLRGYGCASCSTDSQRGSSHPRWNPNLTAEERVRGRKSFGRELKGWKQSVFDRDQYTCQKCLQLRGKIQAHHILPYALFPEVRTDISNGITLCKSCHAKYHSVYGIKKECSHKTMDLYISAMA